MDREGIIAVWEKLVKIENFKEIFFLEGDTSFTFKRGGKEVRINLRDNQCPPSCWFEFHTGVHNIRFDGLMDPPEEYMLEFLREVCRNFKGSDVRSYL